MARRLKRPASDWLLLQDQRRAEGIDGIFLVIEHFLILERFLRQSGVAGKQCFRTFLDGFFTDAAHFNDFICQPFKLPYK